MSYLNATASTSAVGFQGVQCPSTVAPCSGWILRNHMKRESGAGIIFSGIVYTDPTNLHPNKHLVLRDNLLDGATNFFFGNSTVHPDGPPVLSGNILLNVTNPVNGAITKWRRETLDDGERLTASGAVSPTKDATFLTGDCGTQTMTLADCVNAGDVKHFETYATCTTSGSLTPTSFGDGSAITWSLTSPNLTASFDLVCDGTDWWLLGSSNVSVTP